MLSRTADHLFWLSRYTERAENTARMLDVNYQTSLLPQSATAAEAGWRGALGISELMPSYVAKYGSEITPGNVMDFMIRDENNPSSIASCLRAARENARAVRGSLTTETWEIANQTWLEVRRILREDDIERDPSAFFEWVKFRSHLSRGVTLGTMLRDEAFQFMRIGTFLERADNTARLIDVKFHALPSEGVSVSQSQSQGGGDVELESEHELDFYHWSSILRSVSAFEIYRKVYRDVIRPDRVAELLILHPAMPRSLLGCLIELDDNLQVLGNDQSAETQRYSGKLRADLQFASIDEILTGGLHGFLTQFLDRINNLGSRISKDFLIPVID
ncbi:MAG: alpha-E domain-containing protein [Comamonas sp.]